MFLKKQSSDENINKIKKPFKVKVKSLGLRIKKYILLTLERTKLLLKEDKLVILYILGSVINGYLLRLMTMKQYFSISSLLADLVVSIFFASFYFIIQKKYRNAYLYFMSILSTFICVANVVYYFYYSSFISVTFISFALMNTETGDANVVGDLLQLKYFIFLWFPIALIIYGMRFKKSVVRKRNFKLNLVWALFLFVVFLFTLKPVDFSRFYTQWNREYLVSKFGVYLYQVNDLVKSLEPKMASLFGSDKANKNIEDFYNSREKENDNLYTNIFKGKNIIAIHAESIQLLAMQKTFNGKSATPNLNKLASEGLFFTNFYSQVSFGTSSDTEFSLATSLLPINNGTVFINYYNRTYPSFYKSLRDLGYHTFSMHANTGDFWNRNIMHKNLGYNIFYDKSAYEIDEVMGFGLTDKSFLKQSADMIEKISNEHDKFYGTLITLSNHTPFSDVDMYGEFDVSLTVDGKTYPYIEDTKIGNYYKSVRYADEQLGMFVDLLDKKGVLEDTVVVIYGDHDARLSKSSWDLVYNYDPKMGETLDEDDPNYVDIDYYWYEVNRKVPLIIWSKDEKFQQEYSKKIDYVMGMYDVAPTLGNMFGFEQKYALGHDIFSIKENNVVVFPNGNFITNNIYYSDSKEEYKSLSDKPISDTYVESKKEYVEKILSVSDDIIIYDYFNKEEEEVE